MEYFIDYLLFFSKFVSVVVTIAIVIIAAVIIIMRTKSAHEGHIEIRNLNHKFEEMGLLMKSQVLGKKELKQAIKLLKSEHKEKEKQSESAQSIRPSQSSSILLLHLTALFSATLAPTSASTSLQSASG